MSLQITRTVDFAPERTGKYFHQIPHQDCIAVIIPFFNEEANELKETLASLYFCYKYLGKRSAEWKNKDLKIIIIQDGWHKSSTSMKKYLKEMFDDTDWSKDYSEFGEYDIEKDGPVTYVFEKTEKVWFNQTETNNNDEKKRTLDITMLIKIDNRKKHNSHEWFMGANGFGESVHSKYLFCTDAFTMFNKACLYHLITYLDKHTDVAVATGRQRVMTKELQKTDEHFFSLSTILRMVQMFDFESSNALYNGAFAAGGYLPVVPGPCGVYRSRDILVDDVRYWYFDIVNQEPNETGLILGNLRIAEDRILSYSVVLKNDEERKMAFVPSSVFYFEAELELERFILQRRRWINGSVAGYFYLLITNPEHLVKWKTNIFRKMYVSILLMCQFLTYCIVAVGPALSLSIFLYSLTYVLSFTDINYISNETISYMITIFFAIVFVAHMFIHNKNKYDFKIIFILLIFSMTTSILTALSFILYIASEIDTNLYDYVITQNSAILYLFLAVLFMPFFNSIIISGRLHSFWYMIKSFPAYYLFSHMLISVFGSYSYSRIHDLSWGNRPTGELTSNVTREDLEVTTRNFAAQSQKCIYIILLLNIGVFFSPTEFKYGIVGTFLGVSLIQTIFSFLYYFTFIPSKLRYVCDRFKNDITLDELIQEPESPTLELPESINDVESIEYGNSLTDYDISLFDRISGSKENRWVDLNPFADDDGI